MDKYPSINRHFTSLIVYKVNLSIRLQPSCFLSLLSSFSFLAACIKRSGLFPSASIGHRLRTMGSDRGSNIPSKPRYDITMSRRTRKPLVNLKETNQNPTTGAPREGNAAEDGGRDRGADSVLTKACDHGEGEGRKSSLKQLIMKNAGSEESEASRLLVGDNENTESKLLVGGKNSLGQHFKGEEKQQLQLVVTRKQAKEGMEGLKLKGMVGRYVKVVSHLIRVKRDTHVNSGSRKKPLLRLPM